MKKTFLGLSVLLVCVFFVLTVSAVSNLQAVETVGDNDVVNNHRQSGFYAMILGSNGAGKVGAGGHYFDAHMNNGSTTALPQISLGYLFSEMIALEISVESRDIKSTGSNLLFADLGKNSMVSVKETSSSNLIQTSFSTKVAFLEMFGVRSFHGLKFYSLLGVGSARLDLKENAVYQSNMYKDESHPDGKQEFKRDSTEYGNVFTCGMSVELPIYSTLSVVGQWATTSGFNGSVNGVNSIKYDTYSIGAKMMF